MSLLFGFQVKGMMEDFGDKMHCQFLEIIRTLLDANPLSGGAQVHPCLLSIPQFLKIRKGCIFPMVCVLFLIYL